MSFLPRFHLVELHDTEATPRVFRDWLTGTLAMAWTLFGYFNIATDLLTTCLKAARKDHVLDMCSGSGGPLPHIQGAMAKKGTKISIMLSDLYPNTKAYSVLREKALVRGLELAYSDRPIDATACDLSCFRTIFGSWHHFPPAVAQKVLQDVVDTGSSIAIFDATERSVFNLGFFYLFILPFIVFPIISIFQRPFSLGRLFFTFVIPVMPFMYFVDGMVSCLRTYTPAEMRAIVSRVRGAENYQWIFGVRRDLICPNLCYYIGLPKADTAPLKTAPNGTLITEGGNSAKQSLIASPVDNGTKTKQSPQEVMAKAAKRGDKRVGTVQVESCEQCQRECDCEQDTADAAAAGMRGAAHASSELVHAQAAASASLAGASLAAGNKCTVGECNLVKIG